MKTRFISVSDQELLVEFRQAMRDRNLTIGVEFDEDMQQSGLEDITGLADLFSDLLLTDGEQLVQKCFSNRHDLTIRRIVALFDNYLNCLSRRVVAVLEDPTISRRTLDALRKLSFHYLTIALESQALASQSVEEVRFFDHGTGALNQEGFAIAIDFLMESSPESTLAVLLLEFDSRSCSQDVIASMQHEISNRVLQVVREGDLVAQLLPTRWAFGLRQLQSEAHANLAALKLKRLFEKPLDPSDRSTLLKSRIGIAMAPDHGNRADQLLRSALAAATGASRNIDGIQFYSQMGEAEGAYLLDLVSKLRRALFENLLELHYQPQFSISENRVVGLEALLRWPMSDGNVPPPLIVEIIESENLVPQFTQWVLHTALRNFSEFRRQGIDTTLSINLLPMNFSQEELPEIVSQAIDVWRVPAGKIVLELTESSLINNLDVAIRQIRRLKEIGVKVSMDDFGTGYSSMAYLSRLDIDELKIDQSFVRSMLSSKRDMGIVQAIVNLAANFNLSLVAEGVETSEAASVIHQLGCDTIQGYWISRPLSADNLLAFFKTQPHIDRVLFR